MTDLLDSVLESGKELTASPEAGAEATPAPAPTPTDGGETTPPATETTPPAANPVVEPPKSINPSDVFGDEFKEKDWEAAGTELKGRLQRVGELEKELTEVKNTKPAYANETVAKYDAWIRNGGTDDMNIFAIVNGFKEDMDGIDAIIAQKIIENPSYKGFEKMLKDQIVEQYKIEATEDNGLTPEQVQFNKATLAADAKKAKDFLKEQAGKMQVQQSQTVNQEQVIADRKGNWTKAADQILSTIKTLPIPYMKGEGDKKVSDTLLNYQIPENLVKEYGNALVDAFATVGDVTPETVKQFQGEFVKNFVYHNLEHIVSNVVDTVKAQEAEFYDKKYAGAVLKQPGADTPAPVGIKEQDAHIESLFNN